MKRVVLILGILINITCIKSGLQTHWDFNWEILNRSDSTYVLCQLKYTQELTPWTSYVEEYPDTGLILSGKLLNMKGYSGEKEEYFYKNKSLKTKMFHLNSIIFDTTLTWYELEFMPGKNREGYDVDHVSYKTFYLDLPDSCRSNRRLGDDTVSIQKSTNQKEYIHQDYVGFDHIMNP